ncbi:hypothetical protein QAD02_011608 [Eretmocerus hayati]|uniref:Uncharacterized protein n=1 Tax=Eretmocerus hayati TaxID=131215 RepID=A0ACC2P042_9HYME|nr:hypothetical protein QAD02_011608 [Eretmocerus hayati]
MRQLMQMVNEATPDSVVVNKDNAKLLQAGVREFEAQLALARAQGAEKPVDAAQFPNDGLLDLLDMVPFEDSTIPTSSLEPEEMAHRSSKAALVRHNSYLKHQSSEHPTGGPLISADITLTPPELPQISEADISQVLDSLEIELQQHATSSGGSCSDLELDLFHGLSPLEGTESPHECLGEPCGQCLEKLRRYRGAGLHDLSSVFNSVVKKRERLEIRRIFEAFSTKRLSDLNLKKLQETEKFGELGIDLINILRQFFGSMRTTENFVLNDPHMLAKINTLMCCPRFRNDVNFHSYRYRFHLYDYGTKKFLNLLMTTFCKEVGYHCAIYAALMNHKVTSLDHLKAFIEVHDLQNNPVFVDSEDSCFAKLTEVHRYIPAALQPSISKMSTFCYLSFLERILDGAGTTKDLVQKVCDNNDHMFRLATFCKMKFCPLLLKELQRMLLKFVLVLIRNIICSLEKRYAQRSDGKRRFPVMIEDIIECVRDMKIDVLDVQLEKYLEDKKCFEKTYLTFRDIKQSYNTMGIRSGGEKRKSPSGSRIAGPVKTAVQPTVQSVQS